VENNFNLPAIETIKRSEVQAAIEKASIQIQ
jgi:hypothetical protein